MQPKVQRVITEQLGQEHKVLEGSAERKEVKDEVVTRAEEKEQERLELEEIRAAAEDGEPVDSEPQLAAKGFSIAIIKPDAVAQGKVDDIKAEMAEAGLEIIAEDTRELTDEEARQLYSHLQEEEYYEDLIKYVTTGNAHIMAITKQGTGDSTIKEWRAMIGPTNVEEAKEEAPDSMRARFGDNGYMNGLHGSSSQDQAARELAFFFPDLTLPTYLKKKVNLQRTLALIRPHAFANNKDEIIAKIKEAGFRIALYRTIQLTKEQAQDFYKEHDGQAYFDQLVDSMTAGPLLALGLARDEAITAWRDMLGPPNLDDAMERAPNSLRAMYPGDVNQFHGSDSVENAEEEIKFFFPIEQTLAAIKPHAMGTKEAIIEKIHQAGFRIAAQKETTITKDVAELMYGPHEEQEYYEDLMEMMTEGPTYFMVLSREDAVEGWRRELGPTDPDVAKEEEPESFRAEFGESVLRNSVHGASSSFRAMQEMKSVFGELEFNEDGTLKGEKPALDEAIIEKSGDSEEDNENENAQQTQEEEAGHAQEQEVGGEEQTGETTQGEETGQEQIQDGGASEEQQQSEQATSETNEETKEEVTTEQQGETTITEEQNVNATEQKETEQEGTPTEVAQAEENTEETQKEETKVEVPLVEETKTETAEVSQSVDSQPGSSEQVQQESTQESEAPVETENEKEEVEQTESTTNEQEVNNAENEQTVNQEEEKGEITAVEEKTEETAEEEKTEEAAAEVDNSEQNQEETKTEENSETAQQEEPAQPAEGEQSENAEADPETAPA